MAKNENYKTNYYVKNINWEPKPVDPNNPDAKVEIPYLYLVTNYVVEIDGKFCRKQKLLFSFGRYDEVEKNKPELLALLKETFVSKRKRKKEEQQQKIEEILQLVKLDKTKYAEYIQDSVNKVIDEQSKTIENTKVAEKKNKNKLEEVTSFFKEDTTSVASLNITPAIVDHVLENHLELGALLSTFPGGRSKLDLSAISSFIIASKICDPSSIRSTYDLQEEFLGDYIFNQPKSNLYTALDLIADNKDEIMVYLNKQVTQIFNRRLKFVYVDGTNTYFHSLSSEMMHKKKVLKHIQEDILNNSETYEDTFRVINYIKDIQAEKISDAKKKEELKDIQKQLDKECLSSLEQKALAVVYFEANKEICLELIPHEEFFKMFGCSKEGRFSKPLVHIMCVVDEHKFVLDFVVMPGNTSEKTSYKELISKIKDNHKIDTPLVYTADSGVNSITNQKMLVDEKQNFIVGNSIKKISKQEKGACIFNDEFRTTPTEKYPFGEHKIQRPDITIQRKITYIEKVETPKGIKEIKRKKTVVDLLSNFEDKRLLKNDTIVDIDLAKFFRFANTPSKYAKFAYCYIDHVKKGTACIEKDKPETFSFKVKRLVTFSSERQSKEIYEILSRYGHSIDSIQKQEIVSVKKDYRDSYTIFDKEKIQASGVDMHKFYMDILQAGYKIYEVYDQNLDVPLTPYEILTEYTNLSNIEKFYRNCKSYHALRPVHVRALKRIIGHISYVTITEFVVQFICRIVEIYTNKHKLPRINIECIIEALQNAYVTAVVTNKDEGFFLNNTPGYCKQAKKLNIEEEELIEYTLSNNSVLNIILKAIGLKPLKKISTPEQIGKALNMGKTMDRLVHKNHFIKPKK